jgi:hypothetical protein
MVRDDAQLYTIEGFAAAVIMVASMFLVINATSVYTPGDAHISDMQLETLGSDALKMMDTAPNRAVNETDLQNITQTANATKFDELFRNYTNVSGTGPRHDIQYSLSYSYRDTGDSMIHTRQIGQSRILADGEHPVRATRWVLIRGDAFGNFASPRAVLVEVLLWRD